MTATKFSKGERWGRKRKLEVLDLLKSGKRTCDQIVAEYGLSNQELDFWMAAFAKGGLDGLKATRSLPKALRSYRYRVNARGRLVRVRWVAV